jgi:GT2 family glycosyltransferase
MQTACRVSVIILVVNGEAHVRQNLTALAESGWRPHQLIVATDGCTDDSLTVAQRYAARVLAMEEGSGPVRARSRGCAVLGMGKCFRCQMRCAEFANGSLMEDRWMPWSAPMMMRSRRRRNF